MGYDCVTRSGTSGTAAFTNGLITRVDSDYRVSATQFTSFAGFDVATLGVKQTLVFQLRFAEFSRLAWRIRGRVTWEVTGVGAAAARVRANIDARRNGVAIQGLTAFNGTIRSVDALATFTDNNMILDLPRTSFRPGDTLDIRVELETTTLSIGGNPAIRLHHPDRFTDVTDTRSLSFDVDSPRPESTTVEAIARTD